MVNKARRRFAVVIFGIGAVVYTVSFASFGHQNRGLAVCGLGIQLVGVVVMVADMFASWRARRARMPLR